MNWITDKILCFYLAIVLIRTTAVVRGCDPYPPCGIVAKGLELTNTPGIVHVILGKHAECGEEIHFETAWNELDVSRIEIDTETGTVRTHSDVPWAAVATSVAANGLDTLPTVDQSGYHLSLGKNTGSILVTGRRFPKQLVFDLPGLVAPDDPDEILSFYSGTLQRLFFIYEQQQEESLVSHSPYSIASCSISHASCDTADTTLEHFWALRHQGIRVYDDLRLVGFPARSSCGGYRYYSFNRRTLVTSVATLNNGNFSILGVDARTGVAYSVGGGGAGGAVVVRTEKIRGGGGRGVLRSNKKTRRATRIPKRILNKSFAGASRR